MNEMKKRRGQIKAQLTKFQTFINNYDQTDEFQIQIRLEKAEKLWDLYDDVQSKIESLEEVDDTDPASDRNRFETTFYETIARARQLQQRIRTESAPELNTSITNNSVATVTNVKLPTLNLPTFAGKYTKWLTFRDSFTSLINNNQGLTNIQRFQYLKGALKDEAFQIIQAIETTEENYKKAWDLLQQRFENKKLIINSHLKALFNLQGLTKGTATALRSLIDTVRAHTSSLKALKEPVDHWDTLLVYMIAAKLDYKTRQQWEEKASDANSERFEEFLSFLTNRCQMLELTERSSQGTTTSNKRSVSLAATAETSGKLHTCEHCQDSHFLFRCPQYLNLSPAKKLERAYELKLCTNCLKPGHYSKQCGSSGCRKCGKRHNTLLHEHRQQQGTGNKENQVEDTTLNHSCNAESTKVQRSQVLLSTAIIHIKAQDGSIVEARALLDSGAQSHFITKELANKLGQGNKAEIQIRGINSMMTKITEKIQLVIKSKFNNFERTVEFLILPQITEDVPQSSVNPSKINIPDNIVLADPNFYKSRKIDILLGSQIFWELTCIGQIKLGKGQPILQKTHFGWIISGELALSQNKEKVISCLSTNIELQDQLERFWKLENIESRRNWTKEEKDCEAEYKRTIRRQEDGRFIVGLPKKPDIKVGDSFEGALRRYRALEKRLEGDTGLKLQYEEFMKEYIGLKHMSRIDINLEEIQQETFFLPHHPVINQNSSTTKVRVVFDGSFKTSTGNSLNDKLMAGPIVQEDLFHIILRFRIHKFVITADIEKMFRQVMVVDEDRHLQLIIWRDQQGEIEIYSLNTVTYGTKPASFLSTRSLKQLNIEEGNNYPSARLALEKDFYMDDVLTGADTIEEATRLQKELDKLLRKGQFILRKWRTNNQQILAHLEEKGKTEDIYMLNKTEVAKSLGILWNSVTDNLQYEINHTAIGQNITKRIILGEIAKIFDPLGLLGPITTRAKIIMQKLWTININWDESLPQDIYYEWQNYRESLHNINELEIERNINPQNQGNQIDIHGFCDASEKAYGACVYAYCLNDNQEVVVKLICSKGKVAPLKKQTLPRLELCGALVLARLVSVIAEALGNRIRRTYLWSDSTIVLAWLKTDPTKLKTFVSNRVSEIQELTVNVVWQHVRSEANPADLLSRGLLAEELRISKLWWNGPEWLKTNIWPNQNYEQSQEIDIETKVALITTEQQNTILRRYSSITRLQRVLAYCLRFVNNSDKKKEKLTGNLSSKELQISLKLILKLVQKEEFSQEIEDLTTSSSVRKKSKLLNLNPFIDDQGLIRVGGRLRKAILSEEQKHPIILPEKHPVTRLLIKREHHNLHHCGHEQLLAHIRQRYWPIRGRNEVKNVIKKCLICFKFKPKPACHIMADLPKDRIIGNLRPFTICGVDYAGPISTKESNRRGRIRITKAYIAVFVCFNTKAVHIELVSDLTSDCFIAALRRFVARRGICSKIYSDNATNFVAANRKLREVTDFLVKNNEIIKEELAQRQIEWNYIPPRAPHFGGLWEAAVKAVKTHFIKVTQNVILTFEECCTLLSEIEAILNSRPLTPLSTSPNDFNPLTPSHFLIGESLLSVPTADFTHVKVNQLTRWQHLQKIRRDFWQRWYKEYLHQLQVRSKWHTHHPNVRVGSLVLLIEDNIPPMKWSTGRILEIHPGEDGIVRVVTVQCVSGVLKRPVKKVCVLPSEEE